MTIRAQNATVRLMRGSEIVIMESVQREDGRCESFAEHDEPVMELHTEWKHQAMPGSPVTEIRYQCKFVPECRNILKLGGTAD